MGRELEMETADGDGESASVERDERRMEKVEEGSSEGSFVLFYMGASMLDSSIVYTSSMMPWIVAEILRFSNNDMVGPLTIHLLLHPFFLSSSQPTTTYS